MGNSRNPSVLAAMAGITNGNFARQCLIDGGAGLVTIGGYPIGEEMILSSIKAAKRGRREFILQIGKEESEILREAQKIPSFSQLIINLRLNNSKDAKAFAHKFDSLLEEKPLIEINAHCQQVEITQKGGGQSLLERLDVLENIIRGFYAKDFRTSLKIRSNAIQPNLLIPKVNQWPVDFLHIDAYRVGRRGTDLEVLKYYAGKINALLIGNNSVVDIQSARAILDCGAQLFSVARAARKNPLIFRSLVKPF